MEITKEIKMLPWQLEAFAACQPVKICVCGRGAGKTDYLGLEAFSAAIEGRHVIIAAPTYRQAYDVLNRAKSFADVEGMAMRNSRDGFYLGKGIVSLYSGVKPDNARGKNCSKLIVDEAAFCSEYFVKEVLGNTVRQKEFQPQKVYASSPLGTDNWLSQDYLHPSKHAATFRATFQDNIFTSKFWRDNAVSEYSFRGDMAKRRELFGEILDYTENSPFSPYLKNMNFLESCDQPNEKIIIGVDIALGMDFSAAVTRKGNYILSILKQKTEAPEELPKLIERALSASGYATADLLYYDASGQGRFAEHYVQGFASRAIPVNFGAGATDKRCVNMRAQCYIGLHDRLKEGIKYSRQAAALKDELIRDLLSTRTTPDGKNSGKFGLIDKDVIKKEINRSPDVADAAALAFVAYNPPDMAKARANMEGLMA